MTPELSPSGRFTDGRHWCSFPVYYEDTDAGGVVYYANYLKFAERARTEALRAMGISQAALRDQTHAFFVVTHCNIAFKSPARLDDRITIETQLLALRKVRMSMRQILTCDQRLLVELAVDIAMINDLGKPVAIPEHVAHAVSNHLLIQEQGD